MSLEFKFKKPTTDLQKAHEKIQIIKMMHGF